MDFRNKQSKELIREGGSIQTIVPGRVLSNHFYVCFYRNYPSTHQSPLHPIEHFIPAIFLLFLICFFFFFFFPAHYKNG